MSAKNLKPKPESQRVGFAIVGIGKLSAEQLIPAIRTGQDAYVAALVTGDVEDTLQFSRAYDLADDDVYHYDDFEALAQRDDVQAVYIVLPNSMHREFVERAAKIGKHVLCEKPLASNLEDAKAMVKACKKAKVLLMTAYRIQYTPHHWEAKKTIAAGKLGQLKVMDSIHTHVEPDPTVWRLDEALAGGGPVMDIGIYSINTLRFLTGLEPQWVFAQGYQPKNDPRFAEVEESMSIMLGFEGGLIANILTSYGAQSVSTVHVLGDAGAAVLDPAFAYRGIELSIRNDKAQVAPQFAAYDQFGLEIDHFAQCVRSGKTPYTPGEEGVQDHRIFEAVYKSARKGKRVELKRFDGQDVFRGTPPKLPK